MPNEGQTPEAALERGLVRMRAALAAATAREAPDASSNSSARVALRWGALLLGLSAASLGALVTLGAWPFVGPAAAFGVGGAVLLGRAWTRRRSDQPYGPPHIGIGATVSASALVEPGAVVGMGATIGEGAVIRSGAVVGMGSTVGGNAVLDAGARLSWGATLCEGASLGPNAVVGMGATVGEGVQVPAGTRLRMGATVTAGWFRQRLPGVLLSPAPSMRDAVQERANAACDRLASELRTASAPVRSFLGASEGTIAALRRTCQDLFERERAVLAELAPSALSRLDSEKKELEARLIDATDERLRTSLTGAAAAIDERRRQQELLRLSADRLQAERMRLVYTLEGLAAQFVRLRTAGAEAGRAPTAELEQGVRDLGAELDAIADALEAESQDVSTSPKRVRG